MESRKTSQQIAIKLEYETAEQLAEWTRQLRERSREIKKSAREALDHARDYARKADRS